MNCAFYKLDYFQKKVYFMLLEMIKEINFEAFIDIRKKLFFLNNNTNNSGETERSGSTMKVFLDNIRAKDSKTQTDLKSRLILTLIWR
jgi:hypothetical protein